MNNFSTLFDGLEEHQVAVKQCPKCNKILESNNFSWGINFGIRKQRHECKVCEKHLHKIRSKLRKETPAIIAHQHERLLKRLSDIDIEVEPGRVEQELVILAQKLDVAEELDRLVTHVLEVRRNLKADEPVGRRLDFLMQELNREANTLSSKAAATSTTMQAVDLKVSIEQMREQIQNIE